MSSKSPTPMEGLLSKLAVPHGQLPSRLYVVFGPDHQVQFERQHNPNCNWDDLRKQGIEPEYYKILGGLRSPCPNPLGCVWSTASIAKILEIMKKHFLPNTHQPLVSCFIRTFESYDDALYWAQRFGYGTGFIFHIHTSAVALPEIKAVHVLRPYDLDNKWPKDQFLWFHQIPLRVLTHMTEIPEEMMRQRFPNYQALRALPIQDFHPGEEASARPNPEPVHERTTPPAPSNAERPAPIHERTQIQGYAPTHAPELARTNFNKPQRPRCPRCGKARKKPWNTQNNTVSEAAPSSASTRPTKRVRISDTEEIIPDTNAGRMQPPPRPARPTAARSTPARRAPAAARPARAPPAPRPIINHRYATRGRTMALEQDGAGAMGEMGPPPVPIRQANASRATRQQNGKDNMNGTETDAASNVSAPLSLAAKDAEESEGSNTTTSTEPAPGLPVQKSVEVDHPMHQPVYQPLDQPVNQPVNQPMVEPNNTTVHQPAPMPAIPAPLPTPRETPSEEPAGITADITPSTATSNEVVSSAMPSATESMSRKRKSGEMEGDEDEEVQVPSQPPIPVRPIGRGSGTSCPPAPHNYQ